MTTRITSLRNKQMENNRFSERIAVMLTIYLCFSYILKSVGMRNREGWVFLAIYWVYAVLRYRGCLRITRMRLAYTWIGVVALDFFLLPIANNGAKNIQSLIVDIMFCVLYLLCARIDNKNWETIINIFLRTGLFLALFSTFCSFFPRVYSSVIAPHLAKVEMIDNISTYDKGYGVSIGGSTVYASYIICVGVFFCYSDLLFGSKFRKKYINVIYLIVFFLGLFSSGRRGTPLGLSLAMLLIYAVTTPQNAKKLLKRTGLLLAILLAFTGLVIVLIRNGYLARYVRTFELLLGSNININVINRISSSRLYLWMDAWKLFLSSPIIGVGWGTFALHVTTIVTNVHNCWLQFLCETGIIGFVCIGVPIVSLYINGRLWLKRSVRTSASGIQNNILLVATGVQLYLLIMITIEPVFYKDYYHMLLVMMILLGEYGVELEKNGL